MTISVPSEFASIGGTLMYRTLRNGRLLMAVDTLESLAGKSIELDKSQEPQISIRTSSVSDISSATKELIGNNVVDHKIVHLASCCTDGGVKHTINFHE